MKLKLLVFLIFLCVMPLAASAAPSEELQARLIKIADPDQLEAYSQLNLTSHQEDELRRLAEAYAPQFQQAGGQPIKLMGLATRALAEADRFLTPTQRPLVRKLIPRPHQWEPLTRLRASSD